MREYLFNRWCASQKAEFVLTHQGIQADKYDDNQGTYRAPVKGKLRPGVTGPNPVSPPRGPSKSPALKSDSVFLL